MSRPTVHLLYRAAAKGQLDSYLNQDPASLSYEVADLLDQDFARAVEFGDGDSAALAAAAAAAVLMRLGDTRAALTRQLQLVELRADTAATAEDHAQARASALVIGARAQDDGWFHGLVQCWLTAAQSDFRLAVMSALPQRQQLLLQTLGYVADITEGVAERPGEVDRPLLRRLTALLGAVTAEARVLEWQEESLVSVRALMRRSARAGERVVPRGIAEEIFAQPGEVKRLEYALQHLFAEYID